MTALSNHLERMPNFDGNNMIKVGQLESNPVHYAVKTNVLLERIGPGNVVVPVILSSPDDPPPISLFRQWAGMPL
jgi:hypothetical protein